MNQLTELTQAIENHKIKVNRTAFIAGFIAFVFPISISYVPFGIIPGRRASRIQDPSGTVVEMFGTSTTWMMVALFSLFIAIITLADMGYFKMRKDLKEGKYFTFKGRIKEVLINKKTSPVEIFVATQPQLDDIEHFVFMDYPDFPSLYQGQEVEITLTENARIPFRIMTKNEARTKEMDDMQIMQNLFKAFGKKDA